MPIVIPITREVDGPSFFDLQVVLDGTTYTLEFRWNDRLEKWFMAVLDAEGINVLMPGLALVADWFFPQWIVDRAPGGLFLALDTAASAGFGTDPGFDDLGNRVVLMYLSESEI